MRVDLLLQHLDIGIPEQQLLFIVFIPQSLYIGFHFVKADMQLPDLIGTETVIVVSGVLRILESLSEACLLYTSTGRDPGHFFEKFKEIGIAGEAEKFLYLGDGPALCQHRLGEVSPLHGDIMPDGGMGMFLEQAPEIVLVQVEFCSNAFQGQWLSLIHICRDPERHRVHHRVFRENRYGGCLRTCLLYTSSA